MSNLLQSLLTIFVLTATMTDNGRIQNIEGVANAFGQIMAAERGEVICEVTTAKVLLHIIAY